MSDDHEIEDRQITDDEEINITVIQESEDCDIVEQLLDDISSDDENTSDSSDDSETEELDYNTVSALLLHYINFCELLRTASIKDKGD